MSLLLLLLLLGILLPLLLRLRLRLRLRLLFVLLLLLLSGMLETMSILLFMRRLLVTRLGRIERILKMRRPLLLVSLVRALFGSIRFLEKRRRVKSRGRRFSSEMLLVETSR